jgi:hypothetical protein
MHFNASISSAQDATTALEQDGFCWVSPSLLSSITHISANELAQFTPYWDRLAQDHFLKDAGQYRLRRHSSYRVNKTDVEQVPHRAHWQSIDHNALHGGIERLFEPVESALSSMPAWARLMTSLARLFTPADHNPLWFTEAHQFRINTNGGMGRPTPEGAHRDGVDFVAIILMARHCIKGGETRVFNIAGNEGLRLTLTEPFSMLLLNDHRIIHETTAIQDSGGAGHRDTLVLTYRSGGFQSRI